MPKSQRIHYFSLSSAGYIGRLLQPIRGTSRGKRVGLMPESIFLTASVSALAIFVLFSCSRPSSEEPDIAARERPPIAPNGLPESSRDDFYHLAQGGNLLPFRVFMALEQPDSKKLFRQDLDRFGFLPDIRNEKNPYGLPVGMTVETAPDLKIQIVGVNCTACHVGEIQYDNGRYRIEGAPNLLDYTEFNLQFAEAMSATMKDPEKLFRFVRRYFEGVEKTNDVYSKFPTFGALREKGDSMESDLLNEIQSRWERECGRYELAGEEQEGVNAARQAIVERRTAAKEIAEASEITELPESIDDEPLPGSFLAGLSEDQRNHEVADHLHTIMRDLRLTLARMHLLRTAFKNRNAPTTPPGPGRFDAFGMVRNLSFGQYGTSPMTAPTSMSPLWGLADHAWYHFLGMTTTVVGRNIAAIDFIVTRDFETTLEIDHINELERLFRTLNTPAWPDFLPPLDADRVKRGEVIFKGEDPRFQNTRMGNCASCHDQAKPVEPGSPLLEYPRFAPEEIGVDPNLATTFTTPLKDNLTLAQAIGEQVDGIEADFRRQKNLSMEDYRKTYEYGRTQLIWRDSGKHPARVLNGIWATAPFLHNNSVPSLADLLMPADQRPTSFPVGDREYDPVRVGYTAKSDGARWTFRVGEPVKDQAGKVYTNLPNGNSNRGHEFGVDLSAGEKLDLIEYLKTL